MSGVNVISSLVVGTVVVVVGRTVVAGDGQFADRAQPSLARTGAPRPSTDGVGAVLRGHVDTVAGRARPAHWPVAVLVDGLPDVGAELPDERHRRQSVVLDFGALARRPEQRALRRVCSIDITTHNMAIVS